MSFGENLKNMRKAKGLSQEDLAELLEVSRQAVSKWEQGIGYPEVDKLLLLAKKLNISLDSLMSTDIMKAHDTTSDKITGSITLVSPHENVIVKCYKVISSGKFKGKENSPKYALFAVCEQVTSFWGQPTLFLGWYAKEEDLSKEIAEIKQAIETGMTTYELKYSVQVEKHWMQMKIVETLKSKNSDSE